MRHRLFTLHTSSGVSRVLAVVVGLLVIAAIAVLVVVSFVMVLVLGALAGLALGVSQMWRWVRGRARADAAPVERSAQGDHTGAGDDDAGVVLDARRGPHGWSIDPAR